MKCLKMIFFSLALFHLSCTEMESIPKDTFKNLNIDVVYGQDNRMDFFEIQDEHWKKLALSTVALVDYRDLEFSFNQQNYKLKTKVYGKSHHLCEDEKFYSQPKVSFCSGFLIGEDTIVTAGHCIRNEYNCENARFVFGYNYSSTDQSAEEIPTENVYSCSSILHTNTNALTGVDMAILKTDRPVKNFAPLLLRSTGEIKDEAPLTVIGYPSGLPGKFANKGIIRDNSHENFFVTTLDTYGGNSGSAVFNSDTRLVEGILVRGEDDFVYDKEDKCRRSYVCSEASCRGEDVVRIRLIYDYITPADL